MHGVENPLECPNKMPGFGEELGGWLRGRSRISARTTARRATARHPPRETGRSSCSKPVLRMVISGLRSAPKSRSGERRSCACERISSEWCKSTAYQRIQYVADCNCVAARRGGEQRKANNQSAGDKLDLAGTCDELASVWRSPEQQLMPPPEPWVEPGQPGICAWGRCCRRVALTRMWTEKRRHDVSRWLEAEWLEGDVIPQSGTGRAVRDNDGTTRPGSSQSRHSSEEAR